MSVIPVTLISSSDVDLVPLLRRADREFFVLSGPQLDVDRNGAGALAALVEEQGADLAFGAVRMPDGGLLRPPASLDDLRWRRSSATDVAVIRRDCLATALDVSGWSVEDPYRVWRCLRAAAASGSALTADLPLADLRDSAGGDVGPIPLTHAGERFEPELRDDLVLVYGTLDPIAAVWFDGLPEPQRRRLRFLRPSDPLSDLPQLAAAALVILTDSAAFLKARGVLDLLGAMKVPFAFFAAAGLESPGLVRHRRSCGTIRASSGFDPAAPQEGSDLHWPAIFDRRLLGHPARAPLDDGRLRIAISAGSADGAMIARHVLSGAAAVGASCEAAGRSEDLRDLPRGNAFPLPHALSFRQRVCRLRSRGYHLIVETDPRALRAETLLAASYIGAVPVITAGARLPSELEPSVLRVEEHSAAAWAAILNASADTERLRQTHHLAEWCEGRFSGAAAAQRFRTLDRWCEPADSAERERRLGRSRKRLARVAGNRLLRDSQAGPRPLPPLQRIAYVLHVRWRRLLAKLRGSHPFIPR